MSENMREKFNYTQRPETERKFLASDMANALEITLPTFYALARKLDIDSELVKDNRNKGVLMFSYEGLRQCREELERREAQIEKPAPRPATVASAEEHPLVTDERCLNLNYWPETVPACFEVD